MRLRDYFGSFFTRDYWHALLDLLIGVGTMSHRLNNRFWDQVDAEAEARNTDHPE